MSSQNPFYIRLTPGTFNSWNNCVKDATCAICIEDIDDLTYSALTYCGHIFHEKCMMKYLSSVFEDVVSGKSMFGDFKKAKCPNCNHPTISYFFEYMKPYYSIGTDFSEHFEIETYPTAVSKKMPDIVQCIQLFINDNMDDQNDFIKFLFIRLVIKRWFLLEKKNSSKFPKFLKELRLSNPEVEFDFGKSDESIKKKYLETIQQLFQTENERKELEKLIQNYSLSASRLQDTNRRINTLTQFINDVKRFLNYFFTFIYPEILGIQTDDDKIILIFLDDTPNPTPVSRSPPRV
jgi:hypothetical protein